MTSLGSIANVYRSSGPNAIGGEHVRRRIVIQCNTTGRGLVDVVDEIKTRLDPLEDSLPTGYFIEYGGQFEGETWSPAMIIRAGRERVAPVLMTTLTSGIALIPLVIASDEAGKEILYPIATVHIGGLIASTLLEFLVRPALFWL